MPAVTTAALLTAAVVTAGMQAWAWTAALGFYWGTQSPGPADELRAVAAWSPLPPCSPRWRSWPRWPASSAALRAGPVASRCPIASGLGRLGRHREGPRTNAGFRGVAGQRGQERQRCEHGG